MESNRSVPTVSLKHNLTHNQHRRPCSIKEARKGWLTICTSLLALRQFPPPFQTYQYLHGRVKSVSGILLSECYIIEVLAYLMCVACSQLRSDPRTDEPLASIYRHHFLLSKGPCRISCFFVAGVWSALSVSLALAAWNRVRQMSSGWVCSHKDSLLPDCSTSRSIACKFADLAICAKHVTRSER